MEQARIIRAFVNSETEYKVTVCICITHEGNVVWRVVKCSNATLYWT